MKELDAKEVHEVSGGLYFGGPDYPMPIPPGPGPYPYPYPYPGPIFRNEDYKTIQHN